MRVDFLCAQRLSASEIRHKFTGHCSEPNPSSAQRLSASEIRHLGSYSSRSLKMPCSTPFGIRDSTRQENNQRANDRQVLNAFRHQRFDTTSQDFAEWINAVLNAFRHQRFDTGFLVRRKKRSFVLNAFRHQRFDNSKLLLWVNCGIECSTPFGIRDSTPMTDKSLGLILFGAQRLSASEIRHDRY